MAGKNVNRTNRWPVLGYQQEAGSVGQWLDEERPLCTYYERLIGTIGKRDAGHDARVVAPPTRVERIWLIANTMFCQQEGRCEYGAIELEAGGKVVTVN